MRTNPFRKILRSLSKKIQGRKRKQRKESIIQERKSIQNMHRMQQNQLALKGVESYGMLRLETIHIDKAKISEWGKMAGIAIYRDVDKAFDEILGELNKL